MFPEGFAEPVGEQSRPVVKVSFSAAAYSSKGYRDLSRKTHKHVSALGIGFWSGKVL